MSDGFVLWLVRSAVAQPVDPTLTVLSPLMSVRLVQQDSIWKVLPNFTILSSARLKVIVPTP